jgi:hypothetical protein
MFLPGAEAWMVHVSERAPCLVVGGEVLPELPRLGGTRATANLLAVTVEGYHVPRPELVGVALLGVACGLTEVLEVASGTFGVVLVVAGDRLGALLEATPRRLVAFLETTVAVLLLASTPLIHCRLCMGIRYPRDLWMAMIPITRPFRGLLRTSGRIHARSVARTLFGEFRKVPYRGSSSSGSKTTPLGVAPSAPEKVSCLSW